MTHADAELPARVLAVLFLIAVAIWLLRVALLWNPVVGGGHRDWVDLVVAVFAIAQIAIAVSRTLCLFWIDISRSRAALEHMVSVALQ